MIENNSPRAYNLRKKYKQYDPLDVMNVNNTIVTKLTSIKRRKHDKKRYGTLSPKNLNFHSLNKEKNAREAKRIYDENARLLNRLST